jgi:hypothetical protein
MTQTVSEGCGGGGESICWGVSLGFFFLHFPPCGYNRTTLTDTLHEDLRVFCTHSIVHTLDGYRDWRMSNESSTVKLFCEGMCGTGGKNPVIPDLSFRRKCEVNFTSSRLALLGRTPGTHWIGGWVGLRAGLDILEKNESCFPCRESNRDLAGRSLAHCIDSDNQMYYVILRVRVRTQFIKTRFPQ